MRVQAESFRNSESFGVFQGSRGIFYNQLSSKTPECLWIPESGTSLSSDDAQQGTVNTKLKRNFSNEGRYGFHIVK